MTHSVDSLSQTNKYDTINDIRLSLNEQFYSLFPGKYPMNNKIIIGYAGVNDSISIYIEEKLVYSGVTKYDFVDGRGREICRFDRPKKNQINLTVEFHRGQKIVPKKIPINKYNSILIHNQLLYNTRELMEFSKYVQFFLYKERSRFY